MSKYTSRATCSHPGCKECGFFGYDTRAEQRDGDLRRHKTPWRCNRHTNAEKVLTPKNLSHSTSRVLVATPGEGIISDHLFWHDGDHLGSGFAFGDAFKAWAKDFPPGTKLIVESTARIELPSNP